MSKVRPPTNYSALGAGQPYQKHNSRGGGGGGGGHVQHSAGVASSSNRKYVNIKNLDNFSKRLKCLPPDAHVPDLYAGMKFFHFAEHVEFRCSKCRKDNIFSDSIGVHPGKGMLFCASCLTRILRPRTFQPTRVVPFPSLVSWLNYKQPTVATDIATSVTERNAEAVLPTGHRVANVQAMQGPKDLPQIPLNATQAVDDELARADPNSALNAQRFEHHPCLRVWGGCKHGAALCHLAKAPYMLCLAHLMGLCDGSCEFQHERAFGLPVLDDPVPRDADAAAASPSAAEAQVNAWMRRRQKSSNQAEWQLWNNGPIDVILAAYPLTRSKDEEEKQEGDADDGAPGDRLADIDDDGDDATARRAKVAASSSGTGFDIRGIKNLLGSLAKK